MIPPLRRKACQFGIEDLSCGKPSVTKRLRPRGFGIWDVCQAHADMIDRLRVRVREDAPILDKLRDLG